MLPEAELIRVFDKVPIRALTQEVVSNRVVYGNYTTSNPYPKEILYKVGVSEKLDGLEPFYPDRAAGRILDMGDVVSLVEKAAETIAEEDSRLNLDRTSQTVNEVESKATETAAAPSVQDNATETIQQVYLS